MNEILLELESKSGTEEAKQIVDAAVRTPEFSDLDLETIGKIVDNYCEINLETKKLIAMNGFAKHEKDILILLNYFKFNNLSLIKKHILTEEENNLLLNIIEKRDLERLVETFLLSPDKIYRKNLANRTFLYMCKERNWQGGIDIYDFVLECWINKKKKIGLPLLLFECGIGQFDVVEHLVSKGANVDESDKQGMTPLMIASYRGYLDIIKYLISKGANINTEDRNGKTPLTYAIDGNSLEVVEFLTEKGASMKDRTKRKDSCSPNIEKVFLNHMFKYSTLLENEIEEVYNNNHQNIHDSIKKLNSISLELSPHHKEAKLIDNLADSYKAVDTKAKIDSVKYNRRNLDFHGFSRNGTRQNAIRAISDLNPGINYDVILNVGRGKHTAEKKELTITQSVVNEVIDSSQFKGKQTENIFNPGLIQLFFRDGEAQDPKYLLPAIEGSSRYSLKRENHFRGMILHPKRCIDTSDSAVQLVESRNYTEKPEPKASAPISSILSPLSGTIDTYVLPGQEGASIIINFRRLEIMPSTYDLIYLDTPENRESHLQKIVLEMFVEGKWMVIDRQTNLILKEENFVNNEDCSLFHFLIPLKTLPVKSHALRLRMIGTNASKGPDFRLSRIDFYGLSIPRTKPNGLFLYKNEEI